MARITISELPYTNEIDLDLTAGRGNWRCSHYRRLILNRTSSHIIPSHWPRLFLYSISLLSSLIFLDAWTHFVQIFAAFLQASLATSHHQGNLRATSQLISEHRLSSYKLDWSANEMWLCLRISHEPCHNLDNPYLLQSIWNLSMLIISPYELLLLSVHTFLLDKSIRYVYIWAVFTQTSFLLVGVFLRFQLSLFCPVLCIFIESFSLTSRSLHTFYLSLFGL